MIILEIYRKPTIRKTIRSHSAFIEITEQKIWEDLIFFGPLQGSSYKFMLIRPSVYLFIFNQLFLESVY